MPAHTIKLDIEKVEELFIQYDNQYEVLLAIYKMVMPDWDDLESINGSPKVSLATWQEICSLFIDFDKKHHPEVLAGGIWMNSGFSVDYNMEDGVVDLSSIIKTFKEDCLEEISSVAGRRKCLA